MQSKEEKPLFSILIANYNNGKYLQECLDSVFAQTYTDWEIILVDDASTDSISNKIYEKYKGSEKIKILKNKTNKGVGYSKNKCAANANGQFACILDPDDALTPNALRILENTFRNKPEVGLIYGEMIFCDNQLRPIKVKRFIRQLKDTESVIQYPITGFDAFRLDVYKKTKGFNKKLRSAVDQDLYLKFEEISKLYFLQFPIYYYRKNRNGLSQEKQTFTALENRYKVQIQAHFRRIKTRSQQQILSFHELRVKIGNWMFLKFINNVNNNSFFLHWFFLSLIFTPKRFIYRSTWVKFGLSIVKLLRLNSTITLSYW